MCLSIGSGSPVKGNVHPARPVSLDMAKPPLKGPGDLVVYVAVKLVVGLHHGRIATHLQGLAERHAADDAHGLCRAVQDNIAFGAWLDDYKGTAAQQRIATSFGLDWQMAYQQTSNAGLVFESRHGWNIALVIEDLL